MAKVALTQQQYNDLLSAERGLTDIVDDLDKAEKCGIDCQQKREALRNQLAAIQNIKAFFAPVGTIN